MMRLSFPSAHLDSRVFRAQRGALLGAELALGFLSLKFEGKDISDPPISISINPSDTSLALSQCGRVINVDNPAARVHIRFTKNFRESHDEVSDMTSLHWDDELSFRCSEEHSAQLVRLWTQQGGQVSPHLITSEDRDITNAPLVNTCARCGTRPGLLDRYGEYHCAPCLASEAIYQAGATSLEDMLVDVVMAWAGTWGQEFTGQEMLEILEIASGQAELALNERLSKVGRADPPEDVQPVHSAAD